AAPVAKPQGPLNSRRPVSSTPLDKIVMGVTSYRRGLWPAFAGRRSRRFITLRFIRAKLACSWLKTLLATFVEALDSCRPLRLRWKAGNRPQPLAEHLGPANIDCSGLQPMIASDDLMRCVYTLVAIHRGVMWIEECQPITSVELAIRHH